MTCNLHQIAAGITIYYMPWLRIRGWYDRSSGYVNIITVLSSSTDTSEVKHHTFTSCLGTRSQRQAGHGSFVISSAAETAIAARGYDVERWCACGGAHSARTTMPTVLCPEEADA